jgi:RNA polymerase sigma-70 factor (ECF subfamily)
MATAQLGDLRQFLSKFLGKASNEPLPDGQLLHRYVVRRDEQAFAALVERYGPLVLGVCNRVLRNAHDAEDAFQATFFVLARRADSLDGSGALANWLYTVAYRTAVKVRNQSARRQTHERQVPDMQAVPAVEEARWDEIRPVLDEELSRMPEKYRAPLVLCCLEGMSHQDAARQLGWPSGSMSRRMTRAREILRERLARRGITLSAGLLVALLFNKASAAVVPQALATATAKAAVIFGAHGVAAAAFSSAKIVGLAQEVLRTTIVINRMKLIGSTLLMLLLLLVIGTGSVAVAYEVSALVTGASAGACGNAQPSPAPEGEAPSQ